MVAGRGHAIVRLQAMSVCVCACVCVCVCVCAILRLVCACAIVFCLRFAYFPCGFLLEFVFKADDCWRGFCANTAILCLVFSRIVH